MGNQIKTIKDYATINVEYFDGTFYDNHIFYYKDFIKNTEIVPFWDYDRDRHTKIAKKIIKLVEEKNRRRIKVKEYAGADYYSPQYEIV